MKIDVLSQNTLKLTLSKLDMFDLDIKYESLSGKNPETKRLLSHVIKSIQSDKQVSFDFSGERLFIEAFPRVDGGCLLYISCLEDETSPDPKKTRRGRVKADTDMKINNLSIYNPAETADAKSNVFICELAGFDELGGLCRSLCDIGKRVPITSALYENKGVYRLAVTCDKAKLLRGLLGEFGLVLSDRNSLAVTEEYFRLIAENNAAELICNCL